MKSKSYLGLEKYNRAGTVKNQEVPINQNTAEKIDQHLKTLPSV
jgi:hypothetical protein